MREQETYCKELESIVHELAIIFDPLCVRLCPGCVISCCEPCARENGYYKDREIDDLKAEYGFSETKGFLGSRGCLIPRIRRSTRCLSHICMRMQLAIIKERGAEEFLRLKQRVEELSTRHQKIIMQHKIDV